MIGGTGDLLDRLDGQDVVTFTGSADTAAKLRVHPNMRARKSIPFNAEADSLNCAILGARRDARRRGVRSVRQGGGARDDGQGGPEVHRDPARDRAAPAPRRGGREAARRGWPRPSSATRRVEGVRMGALASQAQQRDVAERVATLAQGNELVFGERDGFAPVGEGVGRTARSSRRRCCCAATPHDATTPCTTSRPSARSAR